MTGLSLLAAHSEPASPTARVLRLERLVPFAIFAVVITIWPFSPDRFVLGIWPLVSLLFVAAVVALCRWAPAPTARLTRLARTAAPTLATCFAVGHVWYARVVQCEELPARVVVGPARRPPLLRRVGNTSNAVVYERIDR